MFGILFVLSCSYFVPVGVEDYESGAPSEGAAVIYERGNSYFKEKEYQKAISEFTKIIKKYEDTNAYEPALYLTAFSYFKLKKYRDLICKLHES